jgi:cobalt-zinc-cadmium resistance protein CzcA
LLGALVFTLTFVPVIVSYWFKRPVKEKQNHVYNWVRDRYAGRLVWCLDHPKTTVIVALLIFGGALLLVPLIGGEFLPHLDEGALWVRATMPYTIGFDEVRAASSQCAH